MDKMAAAGIDFGNTSIVIATCKDGRPEILTTDTGEWITPAVVGFSDREQVIGTAAKLGLIRNASNSVTTVKAVIGKSFTDEEFKQITQRSPSKVLRKDGKVYYEITRNGKQILIPATDVAVLMYKNVLKNIQEYCGNENNEVVLAVPLHFGDREKWEMKKAAEKAGFSVLRIIHEPSAAALAYGIGQDDATSDSVVLVYHLGGSSLEVTLIAVNSGIYRIIDTIHTNKLGGRQFDDILVEHFASEFKRQHKQDIKDNKRAMAKLHAAVESTKHMFTLHGTGTCSVESLCDGLDFQSSISRAKFEMITSRLLQNCINLIDELFQKCNVEPSKVDKIILCGGSTKIPRLQALLQDKFKGKELLKRISPEGVVAYGAAIQASLLKGNKGEELTKNCRRINCTARSIAVKVNDKPSSSPLVTVIPSLTPIPVKRIHKFTSSLDNQSNVCLDVYEIAPDTSQGTDQLLAKVILGGLPELPKNDCKISASFHMKIDGSLHIHVSEKSSGKSVGVIVEHS